MQRTVGVYHIVILSVVLGLETVLHLQTVSLCLGLKKVKCAILLLEFRRGAHLPS